MSNILIITPYFRPAQHGGGGQISIENLVDLLKHDYKVTVICYNHDLGSGIRLNDSFIINEEKLVVYLYSIKNFFKILKGISLYQYKSIYFNSFFSPICLLFQIIFFRHKKIVSPKGEFYDGALTKKYFIKKICILVFRLFSKQTIFHSTSLHEIGSIKKLYPNTKVLLARDIPLLNENIIKKESKYYEDKSSKVFKIIYSSRIEPKKNLSFIAKLLTNIEGRVQFDIYGDIKDINYFNQVLIDFKKLPPNIEWNYCGRLNFNDAKVIFANYDLFIFPTLGENFGYVIPESLQCGCPILLSKNTTPWDDLESAGVGYNIYLSDIKMWVDKIRYYKDLSESNWNKTYDNCKNYIQSKLDIDIIINENKEIFKSI